jgi:hypothetical protein
MKLTVTFVKTVNSLGGKLMAQTIALSSMKTWFFIKIMIGNIDAMFFLAAGKRGFFSRRCPVFERLTERSMPSYRFFNYPGNGIDGLVGKLNS